MHRISTATVVVFLCTLNVDIFLTKGVIMSEKPQKMLIAITKEIYTCNRSSHRHLTYDVAEKCIKRFPYKQGVVKVRFLSRNIDIAIDILNGSTLKAAGDAYNVSATRARQIFYNMMRKYRLAYDPTITGKPFIFSLWFLRENKAPVTDWLLAHKDSAIQ